MRILLPLVFEADNDGNETFIRGIKWKPEADGSRFAGIVVLDYSIPLKGV